MLCRQGGRSGSYSPSKSVLFLWTLLLVDDGTDINIQGTAATALVAALAFIKDPNDRNNNMQYLECLSAALQDMAATYQPAERMSVVLRAVMVELRGGPVDNNFRLYKPKSALVPARRGSTIDTTADPPLFKKRQTSRPRAGTGASKRRSMSCSTNVTNIDLTIKAPPTQTHRFDDADRTDGFIMVTPRSEISAWHPLSDAPPLEHGLPTPSTSALSTSGPRNAWMGAELDAADSISQLANVHFPEIPALHETEGMGHLDFLSLGDGGGEWSREWQGGGVGVGSDLDGFPPQGAGFGMGFGSMLNG